MTVMLSDNNIQSPHTEAPEAHLLGSKLFVSMPLSCYIMEYKVCTKLSKHCWFLLQSVPSKLYIYSQVFPYLNHKSKICQYRNTEVTEISAHHMA